MVDVQVVSTESGLTACGIYWTCLSAIVAVDSATIMLRSNSAVVGSVRGEAVVAGCKVACALSGVSRLLFEANVGILSSVPTVAQIRTELHGAVMIVTITDPAPEQGYLSVTEHAQLALWRMRSWLRAATMHALVHVLATGCLVLELFLWSVSPSPPHAPPLIGTAPLR